MNRKERAFQRIVLDYYRTHGRHDLPWRHIRNPYHILVSEIMLQQTQVERVREKYAHFLRAFPTVSDLAHAPLGAVLRLWQGLGYNRRAKMLHLCARCVVEEHGGRFPRTQRELVSLPGIGHYTAGAVLAFAFDTAVPAVETNIRSAIIHHFFQDATDVDDRTILKIVAHTLEGVSPRLWYYALMDYGAYVKKTYGNPNSRSRHYTRQSQFKGSDREIRGAILRVLIEKSKTRKEMHAEFAFEDLRIDAQLERLTQEGLIVLRKNKYSVPE